MGIWVYIVDHLSLGRKSKLLKMRNEPYLRGADGPNWVRVWAGLLILWAFFLLLGTWFNYHFLFVRGRPISWAASLRMNGLAYGIWAFILTPAILFLCARLPLTRRNWFRLVSVHLLAIVGATGADILFKTLLHEDFALPNSPYLPFLQQLREYFLHETEPDIQIYLMVAIIAYVVAYYVDLRSQEWHAAKLQTDLARAELQMLKMQLQPHFLFNTLHSITALVDTDPNAAKKMICCLGDLLRMSLASEDSPEVTLRQELKFLDRYLDIQRVRFQDRLVTEIKVDDEVLDARIPYLILQPLVENAIKHGVATRPGSGKVEVWICRQLNDVCIFVANDSGELHGAEGDGLGIGMENVRNRLRMLYGFRGRLSIEQLPGGRFQVEVRLPFQPGAPKEPNLPAVSVVIQEEISI